MPEDSEHLRNLDGARTEVMRARRDIAMALARPYERGETEHFRELFIQVQATIEAIDRAAADERKLSK